MPQTEMITGPVITASDGRQVFMSPARDDAFASRWLPMAMPDAADETADIAPSIMIGLYPDLYVYGPQRATVEANCQRILDIVRAPRGRGTPEWHEPYYQFMRTFLRLYSEFRAFYTQINSTVWADEDTYASGTSFDEFKVFLPVLAAENRANLAQVMVTQGEDTVCRRFHMMPRENYGTVNKDNFLKALRNYYRYTMLMEGSHYALHNRGQLHDHMDFSKTWGLDDCADSIVFAHQIFARWDRT